MKPFLEVKHPHTSCPIFLINHLDVKELIQTDQVVILTDSHVSLLYGEALQKRLNCHLIVMPAGEQHKNAATKELLEAQMFTHHLKRNTTLIALGGGTVTDMGGFIASTFCRGIPFISIPTTLLGMVDASIGGKNGINNKFGKNLVGTFYPPQSILIDPSFLKTLPQSEISNGMIETVKHALIADSSLFDSLEKCTDLFIEQSIAIKARIVSEDPLEKGKRTLLNFGHTAGHAIELASQYTISHGKAVAYGILMEAELSHHHYGLPKEELERIQKLITRYFPQPSPYTYEELLPYMQFDKKNNSTNPKFVALTNIGTPHTFNGQYCFEKLTKESLNTKIE